MLYILLIRDLLNFNATATEINHISVQLVSHVLALCVITQNMLATLQHHEHAFIRGHLLRHRVKDIFV